jgi:hypothetical protein
MSAQEEVRVPVKLRDTGQHLGVVCHGQEVAKEGCQGRQQCLPRARRAKEGSRCLPRARRAVRSARSRRWPWAIRGSRCLLRARRAVRSARGRRWPWATRGSRCLPRRAARRRGWPWATRGSRRLPWITEKTMGRWRMSWTREVCGTRVDHSRNRLE